MNRSVFVYQVWVKYEGRPCLFFGSFARLLVPVLIPSRPIDDDIQSRIGYLFVLDMPLLSPSVPVLVLDKQIPGDKNNRGVPTDE
jgi:hypothetical protein